MGGQKGKGMEFMPERNSIEEIDMKSLQTGHKPVNTYIMGKRWEESLLY